MHQRHINGVDLNLLPVLAALLEERHVSRAAARVGLTQPAMSRALKRSQRIFDDVLLVGGRDGYTLTPRAERLRDRLDTLLPELGALFAAEHFDPETAQEAYRLALSDYSVAAFGAALSREIRAQSPHSKLTYQQLDDDSFSELDTGRVDLVIFGSLPPAQYCSQPLFADHFVCAVAADHKFAQRRRLSLAEYLGCQHITIDIGRGGQQKLIERTLGRTREVMLHTPFHALAPEMLIGTDLVLTLPARLARKLSDKPEIQVIDGPIELPTMSFHSVWHPHFDNDPSRRWLRDITYAAAHRDASHES